MLGELAVVELEGSFGEDGVDVGGGEREKTVAEPRFFHGEIHDDALAVRGGEIVVVEGVGGEKRGEVAVVVEIGVVHGEVFFHWTYEQRIYTLLFGSCSRGSCSRGSCSRGSCSRGSLGCWESSCMQGR